MSFFRHILCIFLIGLIPGSIYAQCSSGEIKLTLDIDPDTYFDEVTWKITSEDGNTTYFTGAPSSSQTQSYEYCLPDDLCLRFTIEDSYGDGINPGSYSLKINDNLPFYTNSTGSFEDSESVTFNCEPGTSCFDPLILEVGQNKTPMGQTWYAFFPDSTGIYNITTCFPSNTCRTKIWVYDQCNAVFATLNNILGTIAYAEDGCASSDLAEAQAFLEANTLYYIRIGAYDPDVCVATDGIDFNLNYVGPITGCMNPSACNYEPLATLPDTCYFPGDPNCTDGPDLEINENRLKQFFQLTAETNNDACEVFEGCTNGYGTRHKIRFSTEIANIGNQDYFIGEVPASITTIDTAEQFVYDPCHNHWHYRGYADYLLADENGDILPIGSKNGFCVLDLTCSIGDFKYTCQNMGISSGCEDEYDWSLPCQWIDITDIEAGRYTMICRVNWDQSPDKAGRLELDYTNNWGQVCFDLSYNGNQPDIEIIDNCPAYVDCEGTEYGAAKRDCKNVCNGSAVRGDLDVDFERTNSDFQLYMQHALNKDGNPEECTDLYQDNKLSLYDAALLNECVKHADEVAYWGSSYGCIFPTGQENPIDRHFFKLENFSPFLQTFDISLSNNSRSLYGVDLTLDGVIIESVEEIHPSFDSVIIMTDVAEGRIMAFSPAEIGANRTSSYRQLFRVKYSSLTNDTICIKQVDEIVNDLYELATPVLADDICVTDALINNIETGFVADAQIMAFPNPSSERTTLAFPSLEGEWAHFSLTNSTGKVVRSWKSYNNNREIFYRKDLPSGMYQLQVRTENGQGTIRLVFE